MKLLNFLKSKKIKQLEKENEELKSTIIDSAVSQKVLRDQLLQQTDEVNKLRGMLARATSNYNKRSGNNIDCGIGSIGYSCDGSIDCQELMEQLEKVIKNNGVRDTIRILAMVL